MTKHAIAEIGINKPTKEIFMNVKAKLIRAYGPFNKVLHTQHTKNKLIEFIEKFKEVYERDGKLDFVIDKQNLQQKSTSNVATH